MSDGKNFINDVSYLSLWNFSSVFVNFLGFYLITNILGPQEYGKYALVISLIATVSLAVFASVNETLLRFAAITRDRRLVNDALKYQYYFGLAAFVFLMGASHFLSDFYNKPITFILIFASLSFLFTPYIDCIKNFSLGNRKVGNLIKLSLFNQIFLVILVLILYFLNLKTAIFMGVVYFLVSFLTFLYARHVLNSEKFKPDRKYSRRKVVRYIWGGFLFGFFKNIFFQSALIIGSRFVDTVHIAFYTFSIGLATASIFSVINALQTLTVPYVAKFYENKDLVSVNKYFNASLKLGIIVSLFVSVVLYFFLKFFIKSLFPEYTEALNIIPYIFFASLLLNFNTPMSFLKASGKLLSLTKISIMSTLFSLTNSFLLSKYFGFAGMIVSLLINISFSCILSWYYAYKELKLKFLIIPTKEEINILFIYLKLFYNKFLNGIKVPFKRS